MPRWLQSRSGLLFVLFTLLAAASAHAEAERDRFSAGGYFRVMTRPDLQGGDGKLGYWNLYGRLLNEGPWANLEMRYDVLRSEPGRNTPWASVQARIEGGSIANTDVANGSLMSFRLGQLYVKAGNILFDRVTWQIGTLETYFGELSLYDMKPAQILDQMVGLSARYETDRVDLLFGVGDSGYAIRGANYDTVATFGGTARVRLLPGHLELGFGGQYALEPEVAGNKNAPYATPDVHYEDFLRHEVVQQFLSEHPGEEDFFPRPVATSATSWKAVGYLGFGGFGPIRWNNLFVSFGKKHPENFYTENVNGRDFTIYTSDLTDQRYAFTAGDEVQFTIIPGRLDAAWAALYGRDTNLDNVLEAGEDNREYYSTVLRLQLYLTQTVHLLLENVGAREASLNGNLYRDHVDSIFTSSNGISNTRGFEYGDDDQRLTYQLKTGIVLNPTGLGIYTRPSLRFLYGLQYSSQQAAFGSGFVESLDQYNVFVGPERHWHSVFSVEAEGWF